MSILPLDDAVSSVFERTAAIAREMDELREREGLELRALALALADFAREHPLGDRPAVRLSLRARWQIQFQLDAIPSHLGDGLFLGRDGSLLIAEMSPKHRTTGRTIGTALLVSLIPGLLLNGLPSVLGVLTAIISIPAYTVWKGESGTIARFKSIPSEREHSALTLLRSTLDRLQQQARLPK